jgi:hypothetical protein
MLGAAWDAEASASCAGCCNITQASSCITSTSGVRSGADGGWPPNRPHPGGASSSAASPAASQYPARWLSGRACSRPSEGARGTSTCDAAAASPCCGPVAATVLHDSSPVAAALTVIRCALAERRLVVMGVPDLSALAGARAGMIGVTLLTKKRKNKRQPLEIKGVEGRCCSPQVGETPLPLPRGLAVPPSRPLVPPPMTRRWTLPRPPRIPTPWPPPRPMVMGVGMPPLGGGTPPVTLFLLLPF